MPSRRDQIISRRRFNSGLKRTLIYAIELSTQRTLEPRIVHHVALLPNPLIIYICHAVSPLYLMIKPTTLIVQVNNHTTKPTGYTTKPQN